MSHGPSDLLYAVAAFYDLDLEGYDRDIVLYRELVDSRSADGNAEILELGCGTGRVATALAEVGFDVLGVDLSPAMLDVARRRKSQRSISFIEGDMRDIDLERQFSAVLIPLGGLQHMETAADVAAALVTVARHLTSRGLAVIDVEAAHPEDLEAGPQPIVEHWTRSWCGGSVTKLVTVEGEPSRGLRHVTWHYDIQPADGELHRVTAQFPLRVITAGELELAARLAGLAVIDWYGDYNLSPLSDHDDRLIAVLERMP